MSIAVLVIGYNLVLTVMETIENMVEIKYKKTHNKRKLNWR